MVVCVTVHLPRGGNTGALCKVDVVCSLSVELFESK